MRHKKLPKGCVVIVDPDQTVVKSVTNALRPRIEETRFMGFTRPELAWRSLREQRDMEPKLVVTDMAGVSPQKDSLAENMRKAFPRAHILLYSERSTEKQVVKLQNDDSIIHRYVSKNKSVDQLAEIIFQSLADYEKNPVLKSIRRYVAECSLPYAAFMVIGEREFNLVDIYWEILVNSPLGAIMEDSWLSLLLESTSIRQKHN
jgi:DNA-binding NarL/FixJ family response regulator